MRVMKGTVEKWFSMAWQELQSERGQEKEKKSNRKILTENATPKPSRRWITGHEINVAAVTDTLH